MPSTLYRLQMLIDRISGDEHLEDLLEDSGYSIFDLETIVEHLEGALYRNPTAIPAK